MAYISRTVFKFDDTWGVALKNTSVNRYRHWLLTHCFLQLICIFRNISEAGGVDNALLRIMGACVIISASIGIISFILKSIALHVLVTTVHLASTAAHIPVVSSTVYKLLLWKTNQRLFLNRINSFNGSGCCECPARTTASLIFNRRHCIFSGPVHSFVEHLDLKISLISFSLCPVNIPQMSYFEFVISQVGVLIQSFLESNVLF